MAEPRANVVENSFSRQAGAFEDRRVNQVFASGVEWLFEHLDLQPHHTVLDVAGGTGHAARSLAPGVRVVVVLDLTPAMLETGKAAADEQGLTNVLFQRGDATQLPFLDGSFDIVVSRFAVHHFERPELEIAEIARCVRPGGQVVVADLVADDDPPTAVVQNALEKRRDPSHVELLTPAQLAGALRHAGLEVLHEEQRTVERPLPPWLAQTGASDEVVAEVRSAFADEIAGGQATGMHPSVRDGELWFTQRFASVTARRP